MSDRELVGRLRELLGEERRLTAAVLVHLGEVEARELYLPAACSSMFAYCTRVLGMSEDQAFKRIRAARVVRRFPPVEAAVEDGRLHVSGVVLLAPHLTHDNVEARVAEARGKSKAEIRGLVARWAPKPDVPARLERVVEQTELAAGGGRVAPRPVERQVAPGPVEQVAPGPVGQVAPARVAGDMGVQAGRVGGAARVTPISPGRFALQVTIGEATQQKLVRAQALLRHQLPSGDLAEVLDLALEALLDRVERRKLGKTSAPRQARTGAPRAARTDSRRRYVPREVRRQVVARDGLRCTFVGEDGRRCEEIGFLELDHLVPVARGGAATCDNLRVLCRSHNRYQAERIFGPVMVRARRRAADGSSRRREGPAP